MADDLQIRKHGKAGRITLTRPKALNAMTYEMCVAIERAVLQWCDDASVAIIIIDSEGDRAFCAGGDIQQLYDTGSQGDFEFGRTFWRDEYRFNAMLANLSKPYVAIMDGIVMGGGVGISAHGSHRIVTERTQLAMPECGIGLIPDIGASKILASSPSKTGLYIGLSGARLGHADTIFAGFADTYVPSERCADLLSALVETGDPALISDFSMPADEGHLSARQAVIDQHFSKFDVAEIAQSLETSDLDWVRDAGKLMRAACPLSVACSHQIINTLKSHHTIEDALRAEYRFTHRSMSHGDFLEGIRAQIVDKDRQPQWKIPSLEAITQKDIERMLAPLGDKELCL